MDPTAVVGRRVVAWLADVVIDAGLVLVLVQLAGIELERRATTGTAFDVDPSGDEAAWLGVWLVYVAWVGVKILLVSYQGWTPGKLLCGIRVAGWNGRPPGLGRGFVRGLVVGLLGAVAGCVYWLAALASMAFSKEHRQPADWLAGTWVIDATYQGRLILPGDRHLVAGPPAISREEATHLLAQAGKPLDSVLPEPGPRSTEPFYDRDRDRYVVWSERRKGWLEFDKETNEWVRLR
jgi:uncharacterized RDD family membrane protein YckC